MSRRIRILMAAHLRIQRANIIPDAIAGLTFAAVNVPQGMAQALLANVNPVLGLYTLVVATPVAAVFTGSTFMNVSLTSALSVTAGSILVAVPPEQRVSVLVTLTVFAGAIQLILGLLRMGWLTRFIPYSVMTGFINGIAVLIILGQLGDLTGYRSSAPNKLLQSVDTLTHPAQFDLRTLAVGVGTILLIVFLLRTRLRQAAMIIGVVAVSIPISLLRPGEFRTVGDIAAISRSLPHLALPAPIFSLQLLTSAAALAIVGLVQAAGVSRSYPNADGSFPDASRDFLGQGIANVATSFIQGVPAGGSMSGTAVVVGAGARSRWANIFGAIFVAIIVVACASLVALIPMAALAGLLVIVGVGSLQIPQAITVARTGLVSAIAMAITFIAVLVVPLQYAVFAGVGIAALLALVQDSNQVRVVQVVFGPDGSAEERPVPARIPNDGVTVLMIYGSLVFAAAAALDKILPVVDSDTCRAVVLMTLRGRAEVGSTFMDVVRRYALLLRSQGGKLMLSGVGPELMYQLERTGTLGVLGADNVFQAGSRFFASTQTAARAGEDWLAGTV
jgi:sulfate permease, SulP family